MRRIENCEYLVQAAGKSFKKHLTVPKVAKELNLDYSKIRRLLQLYFRKNSIVECRRVVEKTCGVDFSKVHSTPKKLARIKRVFELFQREGTLERTSKHLGITRERVRQLLNLGTSYGLFHYNTREEVADNQKKVVNSVSKEQAIEALYEGGRDTLSEKLGVGKVAAAKIARKFELSVADIRRERRLKRLLKDYNAVVKRLGKHPSAGDLQRANDTATRQISIDIHTHFGGLEKFRKDNGIKWVHAMRIPVEKRKGPIAEFLKRTKNFRRVHLQEAIGVGRAVATNILRDLRIHKKVELVGKNKKEAYYVVLK